MHFLTFLLFHSIAAHLLSLLDLRRADDATCLDALDPGLGEVFGLPSLAVVDSVGKLTVLFLVSEFPGASRLFIFSDGAAELVVDFAALIDAVILRSVVNVRRVHLVWCLVLLARLVRLRLPLHIYLVLVCLLIVMT